MSNSNIITPQDKQDSVDKSSYAVAASPAIAGRYFAHPYAEEAKEEELENLAALPKNSKMSVDYSNETKGSQRWKTRLKSHYLT